MADTEYGVTDQGFVLKRLDTIMEEIHADLTEGFGVDTRLAGTSFLNTLVTTFSGQIAELWEAAQDSYYAKYPATATGVNLDNAVQYGGIRRAAARKTCYPLHCTGDDGTVVREGTQVATNTKPEIRLSAVNDFQISRDSFNEVTIAVAAVEKNAYSVAINGVSYVFTRQNESRVNIVNALKEVLEGYGSELDTTSDNGYSVSVEEAEGEHFLVIRDRVKTRTNVLSLSDNLTTGSVTTIANFDTEDCGKITLPYGIVTKFVNNVAGFTAVDNRIDPIYGRQAETDVELRQSYLVKSALRSNTMIDSIVAELLNNVENVGFAVGYENCTNETDDRGLPPHSIEMIVDGGKDEEIAAAILRRKAGGIQTYGHGADAPTVRVPGIFGDPIPISFSRPQYLYVWLKVILHGETEKFPANYSELTIQSLLKDFSKFSTGEDMLYQLLTKGIYDLVAGVTRIEILSACSTGISDFDIPPESDYAEQNIIADARQKILLDEDRIRVIIDENHP